MSQDVFIPDNPSKRNYACPGCKKTVEANRIGEGASYLITHLDEKVGKGEEGSGKCKYDGPIPRELLGYKAPKVDNRKS